MKLVMQTYGIQQKCKICNEIATKIRRRAKEQERVQRWAREGNRYSASIEATHATIESLDRKIYELQGERQKRSQAIGRSRCMVRPKH